MHTFEEKIATEHPVFLRIGENHRRVVADPAVLRVAELFQIETRDSKTFRNAFDQVPFVVPMYSCRQRPFPLYLVSHRRGPADYIWVRRRES